MTLLTGSIFAQESKLPALRWSAVASLQDGKGVVSPGFAGMICGVDQDMLVLAGGANFPDKMPWEGGKKHYSDEIHVLQHSASGFEWNKKISGKLPEPVAYCGSTSTPGGIVYAGGENESGLSSHAYLLKPDLATNQVKVKLLPELPLALSNIGLTHIGNTVYAVGGDGKTTSSAAFFSLNLDDEQPKWLQLVDLPVPLANAVVLAQKRNGTMGIFVIGGRTKNPSGISTLRSGTFVYDLKKCMWENAAPVSDGKNVMHFSAGSGVARDGHFILLAGGDTGETFQQIENYIAQIATIENEAEKSRLIRKKNKLSIHHSGFYRGLLLYDTLADKWRKIGELPFPAQVTTTAVLWMGTIVLPSGEIKPGTRTPAISLGRIE